MWRARVVHGYGGLLLLPGGGRGGKSCSRLSTGATWDRTNNLRMERGEAVEELILYHDRTKHFFNRYARGPHGLDWANQPNPFRRYEGAKVVPLEHMPVLESGTGGALYSQVFKCDLASQPLSKTTLSQLLYDSLALSAWKSAGSSTWSLRVNPSSGNLHPTEGYVISGAVPGISDTPFVAHYAPKEHSLELRAELPEKLWRELTEPLPDGCILVGLTSIYWREAWKYGERAFRYCNHDVGHAIGALAIAGANLGWNSHVLDGYGSLDLDHLFGLGSAHGKEALEVPKPVPAKPEKGVFKDLEREHGDCILALFPWSREGSSERKNPVPAVSTEALESLLSRVKFEGQANSLSREHLRWQVISNASVASLKPSGKTPILCHGSRPVPQSFLGVTAYEQLTARYVIHKRRSAVDMDARYGLQKETFFQILLKATPGVNGMFPYGVFTWLPEIHLALFVHRVVGLPRGLYFLVRNSDHEEALKAAMSSQFLWEKPQGCPPELPLYCLGTADLRQSAARLSCNQEIAGNSFFSLGMIARFESVLRSSGPWMYPRLFWEAGLLGQMLYLEATAVGVSATGIGCYFDDAVHEVLGLQCKEFQSLYHFTIGVPILDTRILTLPAYPGPAEDA